MQDTKSVSILDLNLSFLVELMTKIMITHSSSYFCTPHTVLREYELSSSVGDRAET